MRILLIGKTGQLGSDLLRNNPGHDILAPSRQALDICSQKQISDVIAESNPDVVINTAAFHDLPQCEADPASAFRINCTAVRDLANACKKSGALFATFSTDYVFDGEKRFPYNEDDRTAPLQIYGISKLAGEHAAMAVASGNTVIIRTCGLYGRSGAQSKGGNFVDKRVQDAQTLRVLDMGCDQVVSPTCSDDLSQAVFRLIEHPRLQPGIYHLTNDGQCTWDEFTRAIYRAMGLDVEGKPVNRQGLSGEMRRPLYSALANNKAKSMGIEMHSWQDALMRYLNDKYGVTVSPIIPNY